MPDTGLLDPTSLGFKPPNSASRPELLVDGRDSRLRQVIHGLFSAGDLLEELRAVFGRTIGLTGRQYQILMAVARLQNGRGIPVKDIARELRVVNTHVTAEIGKMVRIGYLTKLPNEADGRSILVALTDAGAKAVEDITPQVAAVNDQLFEGFGRAEFLVFAETLDKFVKNARRTVAVTQLEKRLD